MIITTLEERTKSFLDKMAVMHPEIEVLGTYVNNSTPISFKCNIDNNVWKTRPDYLISGCGCPECGKRALSQRKTNTKEHFVELVNKQNPYIEIIGDYKGLRFDIKCKCRECGYEFEQKADKLANRKCRCPQCSGRAVIKGVNDIATTHPLLAKYFKNQDEAFKYCATNKAKVIFKCPVCGDEKESYLNIMTRHGYHCPFCDSAVSLPNRVIRNLLRTLQAENFEYEYSPEWAGNYFYDATFIKDGQRYIVEMDGEFHYKVIQIKGQTKRDLESIQARDNIKNKLAKENNAIMIRINCTPVNMPNIIKGIKASLLSTLFDLSSVKWNDIHYTNVTRLQMICDTYNQTKTSATQIGKILHIDRHEVIAYLNKGTQLGLCNYDRKSSQMSGIYKPIRCFDILAKTETLCKSITEALIYLQSKGIKTSFSAIAYHSKVEDNYNGFILSRL